MVFSSLVFIFTYLPIVLLLYYLFPLKLRMPWLFIANFVFYAYGSFRQPYFVLLMLFSILLNYSAGLLIGRFRSHGRLILTVCTCLNLAVLIFFKYYDFLAENLSRLPFLSFISPLGITLPIGISFYTFQALAYPVDVYRHDVAPQKNFIKFASFVSLFPQLIAGPIVRYKDVESQLSSHIFELDRFSSGIRRFTVGLGKKVLLANNIGLLWDSISSQSELSFVGAWLGIIAFSMQIYFDFSGYSDMAIGLGRLLGFEFLENFNYPYVSKSITEFWRRWHISLGSWFRDYVYIPLGGNRKGLKRQFFNIFLVWALTGLWHGAEWNFLLWGIYYALLLMLEKAFLLKKLEQAPAIVSHFYMLFLVCIGWALFANDDLSACLRYVSALFGIGVSGFAVSLDLYLLNPLLLFFFALACLPLGKKLFDRLPVKLQSVLAPILILSVLVLSTAYLINSSYNPFLYFRF